MMAGLPLALGFLTRLPVSVKREPRPADFAWALFWFPAVGVLLGGVLGLLGTLCQQVFPGAVSVTAVIVVGGWVWLTGGLHLDGLADTVDGLSAGRGESSRALAVMRDSRIGAHRAVALVLIIGLKVSLLAEGLAAGSRVELGFRVLIACAVARLLIAWVVWVFPYIRAEGVGASFKSAARPGPVLAGTMWLVLLLLGVSRWLPQLLVPLLIAVGVAIVSIIALARVLSRRLGGLTGDVYGALLEATEILVLLPWGLS